MKAAEIVEELKPLGAENIKKIMLKHGAKEPLLGVKIEELKKFQKKIKKDYQLALDLFDTGIYDAMYLAGLVADDMKMTKADLNHWAANSKSTGIAEYTVPWVASEGRYGHEVALEWIDSKDEMVARAGWATLASLVALKPDAELDLVELKALLKRVQKTIHDAPNRVRYVMNGFVIAVGTYVTALTETAVDLGKKLGKIEVFMGDTACQVPFAPEYIEKARKKGAKKRKTVKC